MLLADAQASFKWDVPAERLLQGKLITNDGPWCVVSIDWKRVPSTSNARCVYRIEVVIRNMSDDPALCVVIFCTEGESR